MNSADPNIMIIWGTSGSMRPKFGPMNLFRLYKKLSLAIENELPASVHGVYRGGMAVHLAMVAMGGNLGMKIDLARIPIDQVERDDLILFSESAGRFIVTVDPAKTGSL